MAAKSRKNAVTIILFIDYLLYDTDQIDRYTSYEFQKYHAIPPELNFLNYCNKESLFEYSQVHFHAEKTTFMQNIILELASIIFCRSFDRH